MEGGDKVPKGVVPRPPFIAIGWIVILRIDETAEVEPLGQRKANFECWWIEGEGDMASLSEVLALVEF